MAAKTATMKPTIVENHDYMSIVLGKRRLSVSHAGTKAGGGIPEAVHRLFDDCTRFKPEALACIGIDSDDKVTMKLVVTEFADRMDVIWPEWNVEKPMPKVGDTIAVDFGKRRGIESGVVLEVKRSYVRAEFPKQGRLGVHVDMIVG